MTDYRTIVRSWIDKSSDLAPEKKRAIALVAAGVATEQQLEAAGPEFVRGIKASLPLELLDAVGPVKNAAGDQVKNAADGGNSIPWVLSDESPNRHGDIVRQDGWDFRNYLRNPVVLWEHANGLDSVAGEPIARAENVRVEKDRLLADIVFDVEDERGARLFRKARAGFVNSGSVGFKPKKVNSDVEDEERQRLGLGRFGVIFEEQELLEFSLCAIPANPNALRQALESGTLLPGDVDEQDARRTERDWENHMRRRIGAHSVAGASTNGKGNGDDRGLGDGLARAIETLAALARVVEALAGSQRELASALLAQSQAITDFGGCIHALRAEHAPAKAPAVQAPRAADSVDLNDINKKLDKILNR